MPSVLPGFDYDVFISYRHNDNRSGWVTEFVSALQEELAATLKDSISVYFDANPHDGLLETHDVGKSLEGKLRCLIFIPIVSQTYCDPKSFAWQHEFCAFNKLASQDQFGRDIKSAAGNVTSRILPVKIHDIDADDQRTITKELGTFPRGIEFIYKEAGVNRPLKPSDRKDENQNKTYYGNQVNKVANAIKEIIISLKGATGSVAPAATSSSIPQRPPAVLSKKVAFALSILAVSALIFFLLYRNFVSASDNPPPKSIAIIPFVNLSSDKEDEYFADGISNEILTQLSKIGSLNVISRTSMLQFRDTKKPMKEIAQIVGADVLLEGTIQKSNDKVHINVKLFEARDEKQLWAETYDKEFKDIFSIQTDVAKSIAANLNANITLSEKALIEKRPTTNLEAYNLYLKGIFEIQKLTPEALQQGLRMLNKSIELDPNFVTPYLGVAYYYGLSTDFYMAPNIAMPQFKIAVQTALAKDSMLADAHALLGNYEVWYGWDWAIASRELKKAIQLAPDRPYGHFFYSWCLVLQDNLEEAKKESARTIELEPLDAEKNCFHAMMYYFDGHPEIALRDLDRLSALEPNYPFNYVLRGQCFIQQGKYAEAIAEHKRAHELLASPWSYGRLAYAYARSGNSKEASSMLDSLHRAAAMHYVASDVIASVYVALGDNDHAFEFLEKAVQERAGWLIWIKVDPIWDQIRSDPRYPLILKKMKLD